MTSDYSKLESLSLMAMRVTSLITGSGLMRKMSKLQELNLSNNRISTLHPLGEVKTLQTLNLNSNRISEISEISLPMLTHLSLDYNLITVMKGLRGLKKLETLSLCGNLIKIASLRETGLMLHNLNELHLEKNQITDLKKLMGFPKLIEITLDHNPIKSIDGSAFSSCPDLKLLSISYIKLPNYQGDLRFLRLCPNLETLRMNSCFT